MNLIPLLKVLLVFAAMLAGIRARLGLGNAILAGSLLLGLLFGMGVPAWLRTAVDGMLQFHTLTLAAIVGLIMLLSELLEKTGQSERLVGALSGFLRRPRLRLIFFPALIGLLPMPGGAVFSAPMVKSMASRMSLTNEDKVLLNYWFRHIWELGWPLYPGMILAAALAQVPLGVMVLYACPGILVCALLGWVFLLRPGRLDVSETALPGDALPERDARQAFLLGLPLLTAIAGALGLEGVLAAAAPQAPFELGVMAALAAAILVCAVQNRVGPQRLLRYLFQRHLGAMLYVIVAIFAFKETLQQAGVVEALASSAGGPAALVFASVALPLLVGVVAGITVAFVGATFPLIIGLVQSMPGTPLMPYLVLALFAGYTGVMASPLHICFILSCQFFGVNLARVWRSLAFPCALLLAFGAAYFSILV